MNASKALAIAAMVTIAAIVAIAALLVPAAAWSPAAFCALALLALASAQLLYGSQLLPGQQRKGGDAANIAAIGPMGVFILLYLGWSVLSFLVALLGHGPAAWAMIVAGLAALAVARLVLHAALEKVDSAAVASDAAQWRESLRIAGAGATDPAARSQLDKLIEKIQFGPSEMAGPSLPINADISQAVARIQGGAAAGSVALAESMAELDRLLGQRESQLRLRRSKA